jgi:F-type H+-transporting ATPase subunit epsilon
MLAILSAGEVRITTDSGEKVTAQADDGFLSVDNDRVNVVASQAEIVS